MNREIKFRAWNTIVKRYAENITFELLTKTPNTQHHILVYQQFTGFKDFEDKEIFEGDIVAIEYQKYTYKVVFEKGAFVLYHLKKSLGKWGTLSRVYDFDMKDLVKGFKVIGNIYENKDLLEPNE